ncbi:potassium voltage-gated channel subfamily C member 2-like [Saccostrea echinata]|uniref:potassium voltage-gated channel subfamily C member 2-like n=1 Tax=Saccostrea echinata TaxID=191078 RepID=UPI002A7EB854|nr:potassium voltage-gated channel subfamily C member 2-like [Saccostrea echinata]
MQDETTQANILNELGATPIRKNGHISGDNERIILNVGGVRHETHVSTLRTVANTRLARLAERHLMLDHKREEYFFDRHPSVFNSVIDFYRTGELHVPLEVCGAVVMRELDFWQVDQHAIKSCCWRHYRSYIENKRILDSFNRSLKKETFSVDVSKFEGWKRVQMQMWLILEHPRTSKIAMAYGVVSLMFVVVSILGFCLETLPGLRPSQRSHNSSTNVNCPGNKTKIIELRENEALYILDIICTVYFTIELVVRFIFAPQKLEFIRSAVNIIDLLALVPLYMQLILNSDDMRACYMNEQLIIEIMFVLRIIRMFRIFHLVKHYQALKILVYALKASLQELLMLAIFLIIGMLIFSSLIYYAERHKINSGEPETITTIPMGFWWAIVTMTMVGYGDKHPTTTVGYIVGTACAVAGVLMIALTIPVISNNFTLFYTHVRSKGGKGPPNSDSKESLVLSSRETEFDEKRKLSSGSLVVEAYMNGTHVIRKLTSKSGSPQYSPILRRIPESNSLVDICDRRKCNGEFDLIRNNSSKAKSDDGVAYAGETPL